MRRPAMAHPMARFADDLAVFLGRRDPVRARVERVTFDAALDEADSAWALGESALLNLDLGLGESGLRRRFGSRG